MSRKPKPLTIQPKKKNLSQAKGGYHFTKNPDDFPCPVCGEKDFEWGYFPHAHTYRQKRAPNWKADRIRGRLCLSCGNVLSFVKP